MTAGEMVHHVILMIDAQLLKKNPKKVNMSKRQLALSSNVSPLRSRQQPLLSARGI